MRKTSSYLLVTLWFLFVPTHSPAQGRAQSLNCATYFSLQAPVQRHIEEGKNTLIVFDSDKREILMGEASIVEKQLSEIKISGYAILFRMRTFDPNILEVGIAPLISSNDQKGSKINEDDIYTVQSITPELFVARRVDLENFLEVACHANP